MPRRSIAYACYGLLVLGAFGVALSNPLLFQKLNTIRPADGFPELRVADQGWIDVENLIRPIPFQFGTGPVWNVHPKTRHQLTILQGRGNCSQMAFGLAYQLLRDGYDYQIIHFLTPSGIGKGDGHTVIRLAYEFRGERRTGVVDVSFGALLKGESGPLDVAEVEAAPVPGWGSIPLNAKARYPYYHDEDDFVPRAFLGYIPPSEVAAYYAYLDLVYFTLGYDRIEKYLFDGVALLLGRLPEIFVPHHDELLAKRRTDLVVFRGALWILRSALLLLPLIVAFELWRMSGGSRAPAGRR